MVHSNAPADGANVIGFHASIMMDGAMLSCCRVSGKPTMWSHERREDLTLWRTVRPCVRSATQIREVTADIEASVLSSGAVNA